MDEDHLSHNAYSFPYSGFEFKEIHNFKNALNRENAIFFNTVFAKGTLKMSTSY